MIAKLLGIDWLARKLGYVEGDVRTARRDMCALESRVQELEAEVRAIPRPNVVEVRRPYVTRGHGCIVCGRDHDGLSCPETVVT